MAGYGDPGGIELGEGGIEGGGEFGSYVGFHFVVFGPGVIGGVDIETGACAEVVGVVFPLDFKISCIYICISTNVLTLKS